MNKAWLLIGLLFSNLAYAQPEVISGFGDIDLPVLNEELRKQDEGTKALESRVETLEDATDANTIVQVVNTTSSTHTACNTALPADDSIPQNTEGVEVMTRAITPTSASNKLRIDVIALANNSGAADTVGAALFQDTTADALAASGFQTQNADDTFPIVFTHYMTAGTTSATTFKVRVGNTGGDADFNGDTSARFYGTAQSSSITITEIKVA